MYQFGFGAFPASDKGMPQQAGYRDKDAGLLEPVARGVVRRFNQQYLDEQAIIREFKSILAAKEIYGPRLWDTPGVVGMQMGLADNGRPVLDGLREHWRFFLLLVLGVLFVLFFWPGLYEYHWRGSTHWRINRVTSNVEYWTGSRWRRG